MQTLKWDKWSVHLGVCHVAQVQPEQRLKTIPGTSAANHHVLPAQSHTACATVARDPGMAPYGVWTCDLGVLSTIDLLFLFLCLGNCQRHPHGCGWVYLRRRMYMWHIQHVISATVWASRSLIPPWHQRRCSWHHLARGDDDPSLVHWHPATWFTWTVTDCTSNLFQLWISGLLSEMHEMSVHERRDQLGRAPGLLGK